MADLKRCDRCKAIFDHTHSEDIHLENGRKKVVWPRFIRVARYIDDPNIDAEYARSRDVSFYDLCPTCTMGLVKFLHNIDEDGSKS